MCGYLQAPGAPGIEMGDSASRKSVILALSKAQGEK